ncbi:hypothetical protein F0562_023904 [Nyssa sinensis]|uniref:Myb-related protein 123 n=1 Tax=Nyssa sinensis TaxID=561372 RepID=A0A5J5BM09_9ASTE|nr:hypothetical protein F0562_023904 [Nyssa sinensis]
MGRKPCCSKKGLNRGAWTAIEDKILTAYIKDHGEGKWRNLAKSSGLKRCGKSCRLRWLNYLRPDIKRGNISHDEEELIIRLHKLLGNRWSLIAGRLPGRTDNEIKNYWNTTLGKKAAGVVVQSSKKRKSAGDQQTVREPPAAAAGTLVQPIRTKALNCTKVLVPVIPSPSDHDCHSINPEDTNSSEHQAYQTLSTNSLKTDYTTEQLYSNFMGIGCCDELQASNGTSNNDLSTASDCSLLFDQPTLFFKEWTMNDYLQDNVTIDLGSLASLFDNEEWP